MSTLTPPAPHGPGLGRPTDRSRRHTEQLAGPGTYAIEVGGDLDHVNTARYPRWFQIYHAREQPEFQPNVAVEIRNAGDRTVRGPRLVANGVGDWFDIDSLLREALRGRVRDSERALALFEFFARPSVQSHNNYMRCGPATPDPDRAPSANAFRERADPVRAVTTYYASGCVAAATNLAVAARAAGLLARVVMFSPPGARFEGQHAATEIWYDGAHHLFDPELRAFYLHRDNRTIASAADILDDPELVRRTHCLGAAGIESPRDYWFATLYDVQPPLGVLPLDPWTDDLDLDLRPGERIEFRWSHRRRYHYGDKERYDVPQPPWRLSNSVLVLEVDGRSSRTYRQLSQVENVATSGDGFRLEDSAHDGTLLVRMAAPFPVVGGALRWSGTARDVRVEVAQHGRRWQRVPVAPTGTADLDDVLDTVRGPALHEFHLRIVLPAGTAGVLSGFEVETLVQLAETALPALRAGRNTLAYRGGGPVTITHTWRERDDPALPGPPAPLPARAGPVLGWRPPTDGRGRSVPVGTYHVMVAEKGMPMLAVCPNLDRFTFSDATSWTVPTGWLRPDRPYIWRVRACSQSHVWSDWSPWAHLEENR